MRHKIEYYYRSEEAEGCRFWAKTQIKPGPDSDFICTVGNSWEEVRAKHMQRLSDKFASPEPPIAEEVEI